MSEGEDDKLLTLELDDPDPESSLDSSEADEEEESATVTGSGSHRSQRKTQFRWNVSRDLTLIREAGSTKPYLEQGKAGQLCWGRVADVVNDLYGGDIDYLAAKRRLKRLLSDLGRPGFRKRYKCDSSEEVTLIVAGLRALKSVMESKDEFPSGETIQNSEAEDELRSSKVLLMDAADEAHFGDSTQVQQASESEESDDPGDERERKRQFRWNVPRDLLLVTEVDSVKPFQGHGKESRLSWGRVADAVNAVYFGDIDYLAARRRFSLLMSDFDTGDFQTRYPSGYEEDVFFIMAKLKRIKSMIRDNEKLRKDRIDKQTSNKNAATRSIPKVVVPTPVVVPDSNKSAHSFLRKIQFRWNAPRDLTLVKEVASQKPFLDFGKEATHCWSRVANAVNETVNSGTTDHVGAKRRFYLLLGDLEKPCFGSRYKSGYEDEVLAIVDGLRVLKTLIDQKNNTTETEHLDKLDKAVTNQDEASDFQTETCDRGADSHSEMDETKLIQPVQCVVSSCTNTSKEIKEDLRFFSFPSDTSRKRQWIEAIGISKDKARRLDIRVCSDHFRTQDFLSHFSEQIPEQKNKRLCSEAVPSLLLPAHGGTSNIINTVEDTEINERRELSPEDDTLDSEEEPYIHSPRKKRKLLQAPKSRSRLTLQPCLICSKKNTKMNKEFYFLTGSNGFSSLNRQLWNTFVLRKILKLPVWKYAELLETAGSCVNPSDWFVVCNMCSETVNKILETQQEIMSLERKVTRLKTSLEEKFVHSSANANGPNKGMLNIRDEIRAHFKDSLKQPSLVPSFGNLEPKEEIPDTDFEHSPENNAESESFSEIPDSSRDFVMEAEEDDPQVDSTVEMENDHKGSSGDEEWIPEENIFRSKKEGPSETVPADPLDLKNEADSHYEFKPASRARKRSKSTKRKTTYTIHRKMHCQICVRRFGSQEPLLKHMKYHAKTKKLYNGAYDCFKCKAPYDNKDSLRNHFGRAHSLNLHNLWNVDMPQEEYIYTKQTKKEVFAKLSRDHKAEKQVVDCEHCTRKYYSKKVLERHLKLHEVSKKLYGGRLDCSQCKAPYTKVESLRIHLKNSHQLTLDKNWDESTPQEVGIIEKVVKGKPAIPTPNEDGSETYTCSHCDCEFKTKGGYDYHIRTHETTPENQHCPKCRRPYPSQEALRKHLRLIHKIGDLNCICELCGFDAGTPTVLKGHMTKHKIYDGSVDHSISTTHFVCTICKELFKTRRVLSIHRVNDHYEELGIDVLKCTEPDCSKVFLRKNGLLDHVAQRHKGAYRYQCEVCGHGTPSKYNLDLHMQMHRKTQQHVCEYCSATYQYMTGFRTHMLKHHPDKYQPKRVNFFQGVQVDKLDHEYGHGMLPMGTTGCKETRRRQLKCKYCDTQLPNKFTFNQHLKNAHADMYSFNCDQCERVYLSEQSLKLHKKLNHSAAASAVTCGWCFKTVAHRMKLYDHKNFCTKRPKGPDVPKIFVFEGGNPSQEDMDGN